jgi:hypothetical protein
MSQSLGEGCTVSARVPYRTVLISRKRRKLVPLVKYRGIVSVRHRRQSLVAVNPLSRLDSVCVNISILYKLRATLSIF